MDKPLNPPAFPTGFDPPGYGIAEDGMRMRDYFAAQAMQALIPLYFQHPTRFDELVAEHAYAYADAMLKERMK